MTEMVGHQESAPLPTGNNRLVFDMLRAQRLCNTNRLMDGVALSFGRLTLQFRGWRVKRDEAFQDSDTDLEPGTLTVGFPLDGALPRQFRFADLRFTPCIRCKAVVCSKTIRGLVSTRLRRW